MVTNDTTAKLVSSTIDNMYAIVVENLYTIYTGATKTKILILNLLSSDQ